MVSHACGGHRPQPAAGGRLATISHGRARRRATCAGVAGAGGAHRGGAGRRPPAGRGRPAGGADRCGARAARRARGGRRGGDRRPAVRGAGRHRGRGACRAGRGGGRPAAWWPPCCCWRWPRRGCCARGVPGPEPGPRRVRGTWAAFLGITLLNPLTVLTFAAVVVTLPPGVVDGAAARTLFVVGAGAASLVWQAVLAVLGATLGRRLDRRTARHRGGRQRRHRAAHPSPRCWPSRAARTRRARRAGAPAAGARTGRGPAVPHPRCRRRRRSGRAGW